jgi:hypothetical protein
MILKHTADKHLKVNSQIFKKVKVDEQKLLHAWNNAL